jgi:putative transposase
MARPLRIIFPNAFYHVMNRGVGRRAIFQIDDDYGMFLEAVKESSRYFDIRVISYGLMPNHYHLLIQTPKANLSRAMRHLNGVYTQRYNRLHKQDGPLFRGRYKAILVQEDEYLTHLIRYIHLNPVQANLTDDLSKYPYTSHKDYLKGKDQAPWLHVRLGLAFFSDRLKQALQDYREFIKGGIDPKMLSFFNQKKQDPVLGAPDFIERIKETYITKDYKLTTEIPEERGLAGQKIADEILRKTSLDFGVPSGTLFSSRRGETNRARLVAVALTRDLSGLRLAVIAKIFRMGSYKSVASSCHRLHLQCAIEPGLKKRYDELSRKLTKSQKEI